MHKFLLLLLLPLVLASLCACRREVPPASKPIPTVTAPTVPTGDAGPLYDESCPLIGTAETREEAEEIAALYGITLVAHSHGAALYQTDEDPWEVIRRGRENGWPELTINYRRSF